MSQHTGITDTIGITDIIGIIGGMGSEATVDLFAKIVRSTPAHCDQDHLHILIDNYPQIPDRQAAVLRGGPDPTPALLESARRLEKAGAEVLCMACNSAYIFLPHFAHQLSVPMLDMVSLTAQDLSERQPPIVRAGLLASGAIYASELYQQHCEPLGTEILTPDQGGQEAVAASMWEVKGGCASTRTKARLVMVAEELIAQGAQAVILACTELPLVLQQGDLAVAVFDPTQILADAVVERAFT
jgi:aspartate racemase